MGEIEGSEGQIVNDGPEMQLTDEQIINDAKEILAQIGVNQRRIEDIFVIDPELFKFATQWVQEHIGRDCNGISFRDAFWYGTYDVPTCKIRGKLKQFGILIPRLRDREVLVAFVSQVKMILASMPVRS